MESTQRDQNALTTLRAAGRGGATLFATSCVERLRPLLAHVPSGAPPLIAGVALTQLWRIVEGAERADPRRLAELSKSCWALVEIEPAPRVPAVYLELLVAAAHDALETYLSGDAKHAVAAAGKSAEAAAHRTAALATAERERQDRDLREIAETVRAGAPVAALATRIRERAEKEGKPFTAALIDPKK